MTPKIRYFIFLLPALAPLYLLRLSIAGIPTNWLEILIVLGWIAALWQSEILNWKKLSDLKPYIFPTCLIFFGLTLSAILNNNLIRELGIIKGWFIFPVLGSLLIYLTASSKEDVKLILNAIFLSGVSVAVISMIYLLYGDVTYDGRLQAFYSSPNYLAMSLVPSLFVGWYLLRSKVRSMVHTISMATIVSTLYFTYSYGTWLATLLSFFIIRFLAGKPKKIFLHASVLFLFISILFLSQYSNEKLTNVFSPQKHSSLESRLVIWKSAFYILKDHWLFGIGPGNFQEKYLEYQKFFPPYPEWAVPQPHNLYLAFWLQSGLAGFSGFLWLVTAWLKNIREQKNSELPAVMMVVVLYFLIHGLVDTPYWKNDWALLFWIFIALGSFVSSADSAG